jgi:putative peptidoglycan lipid II flippase
VYVWGILAGATTGLLAATLARLYSSTYYALRDTRTPLRFALLHVGIATALGYFASQHLPGLVGVPPRWGAAGLTLGAAVGAWAEFLLLRRSLNRRIGPTGLRAGYLARLSAAALAASAAGWLMRPIAGHRGPLPGGAMILGAYGAVYFAAAILLHVDQAGALLRKLGSRG